VLRGGLRVVRGTVLREPSASDGARVPDVTLAAQSSVIKHFTVAADGHKQLPADHQKGEPYNHCIYIYYTRVNFTKFEPCSFL